MAHEAPHPFPTVDVPDHAHYTIGSVILAIGITGMIGNFLVIYAFSRSRSLRTPANMFIINLAITDLLMCVTQTPIFFTTSMHKRWIFGEKCCELYAFCGALFGICSMITLTVISIDRYFVITRPLTSIGVLSRRRAFFVLLGAWTYSLAWSLPPFFGWSAYVPEGLLTSCSWDYMTFTPSVRAIHSHGSTRDSSKKFQRVQSEWKLAKIALIVILLYVVSWSPYSAVALTAFAGIALAKYIPGFSTLLCVHPRDLRSASSSFVSTRRSTVTSQTSDISSHVRSQSYSKTRLSSVSDSESGLTDIEADGRQVSCDISRDTAELPEFKPSASFKSKIHDSGIFEKTSCDPDISTAGVSERSSVPNTEVAEVHVRRGTIGRIPSIVITSETSPFLPIGRNGSCNGRSKTANNSNTGEGPG
ncbi:Melanopsin-A [Dissostichus eleginoides]|uniref:Melanopsin-A n=1 Tax=Dissostichus eleginoides TaxID=100907 RepID=A0AAD9CS49_DISEL|nr:Melanopsin-A [Dissostichus eleginoides]